MFLYILCCKTFSVAELLKPLLIKGQYSKDLDDVKETGIYDVMTGCTNYPAEVSTLNASTIIVLNHDGSNVKQLFLGRDNQLFYRTRKTNSWASWSKVL